MFLHTWTEKRLLDTFIILLTQTEIKLATCVFIDGLDEFEGRYDAVIDTLNLLANKSNVKICVSSRPLLNFEKAFAAKPSLRLQDLTLDSIRTYADKQLSPLIESRILNGGDDKELARRLLHKIVYRARGVFLWAVIAIRDVRDGLNDIADLHELARVIEDLPSELESLYMQMLNRIKPMYRRGAARVLQILLYESETLKGHYSLDLFRLYFIEDQQVSEDSPVVCDGVDVKDIVGACYALRTRLISHTGGLLDLAPIGRADETYVKSHYNKVLFTKISVSHRTVKDFLLHNSAARAFMDAAGVVEEHLRLSIARGTLAHLVHLSDEDSDHLYYDVSGAKWQLHYSLYSLQSAMRQISIVEWLTGAVQLNIMRSLHAYSFLPKGYAKAWNGKFSRSYIIDGPFKSEVDLIGIAASSGMFRYICHVLDLPVDEPQRHPASLSELRLENPADQVVSANLVWNTSSEYELDYSDYRRRLGQSLKWSVREDSQVDSRPLAETYLLTCCEPSSADPNLADSLTLIRILLRAGASPMVQVEHATQSSLMEDFSNPCECFWANWLLFLRWFTKANLAGNADGGFGGSSSLSDCVDSRVTLDDVFNTTKALLAQGADIITR